MEHPLIGSIDHLTDDELLSQINKLSQKLNVAVRSGNGHLCHQIRMAIESYQTKYQQRLEETYKKNTVFTDKIDIQ
jgi:hypothetical protein